MEDGFFNVTDVVHRFLTPDLNFAGTVDQLVSGLDTFPEFLQFWRAHFLYWWVFFVADGCSEDPPVFGFDDGEERTYTSVARTVWEFIESLVMDYELWFGNSTR